MKIVLLIDNLNSGGAQRQLAMLAVLLAERGHAVEVVVYFDLMFYRSLLDERQIPVTVIGTGGRWSRLWSTRRALREKQPDAVIAYLVTPSILAELASIPSRRFALIVSERQVHPPTWTDRLAFQLHRLADAVVVNSSALERWLAEHGPWLLSKVQVIHNAVDLDRFQPIPETQVEPGATVSGVCGKANRLLVVGRIRPEKNATGLMRAMRLLQDQRPDLDVGVDWYGNNFLQSGVADHQADYYRSSLKLHEELGLGESFVFHQPVADVHRLYGKYAVFCLPSFFEGFSNVLAEAAACGRPILASAVCDNHLLARSGQNAALFDPHSPQEMADAIATFFSSDREEQRRMGDASRKIAVEMLAPARLADEYERVLCDITAKR